MIFAETERLFLRRLEQDELPRLVELIGVWDVVRWLSVVPFPYTIRDATAFYDEIAPSYLSGQPQFFALALKTDNLLIGGIGLHEPRIAQAEAGEVEIGYWLGKDYWRRGLMIEAATTAVRLGFARPATQCIGATTPVNNQASQKILARAGLKNLGEVPRSYQALRGENTVTRWLLTRAEYETNQKEKAA